MVHILPYYLADHLATATTTIREVKKIPSYTPPEPFSNDN